MDGWLAETSGLATFKKEPMMTGVGPLSWQDSSADGLDGLGDVGC